MPDTRPEPPGKVALFSGHMIDAPGREKLRLDRFRQPRLARPISRRQGTAALHVAPNELGAIREEEDAYACNNRWMLNSALRFGADTVDFICLWNGEGAAGRHAPHDGRGSGTGAAGRAGWTRKAMGVIAN